MSCGSCDIKLDKRLKKAVMSLVQFPDVKWVKLFGSRARGDNAQRSDYDIAICFEGRPSVWLDVEELLESLTILPMDIINYRKASSEIKGHIDHQGKLILLNEKWYISMVKLGDAMETLEAVLHKELDEDFFLRDSTLQRFEYTIELFWKTFKHLEEKKGDTVVKFPREAISRAYQVRWIDDADKWSEMLTDRNNISHSYNEDLANEIYGRIKQNFSELKNTYDNLKEKFIDNLKV